MTTARARGKDETSSGGLPPVATHVKSRPGLVQAVIACALVTMTIAVVYMYRVIDQLHHDQQHMRLQIAQMRSPGAVDSAPSDAGVFPTFSSVVSQQDADFLAGRAAQPALDGVQLPPEPETGRQRSIERPNNVHPLVDADADADPRRLSAMYTTGAVSGKGCYELEDSDQILDMSINTGAQACGVGTKFYCPDCFVSPASSGGFTADRTLTIKECSSAHWIRNSVREGIWVYTFVNWDATETLTVQDSTGVGAVAYKVPPHSYIQAWCSKTLGTNDKLAFPSMVIPTLTIDSGLTLSAGNFLASGTGTFQTSTGINTLRGNVVISADTFSSGVGDVSLNGNVIVADAKTLTVGVTNGAGGATVFKGDVTVGEAVATHSKSLTVHGNVALNDDADGTTVKTFSTATGAVSLNGHTTIAAAKNLAQATGAGTFTTGTGAIALNGDTTIAATKNFVSGQGNVVLNANVWIADGKLLTVGAANAGAASTSNTQIYGALTVGASGASQATSLTVHGHVTQNDDGGGTLKTFSTAGGAVSLNGNVDIAANKHLKMTSGTGTFVTGTGLVVLNGNTEVTGSGTFMTGTGLVSLKGSTQVVEPANFQVGTAGTSAATSVATFYGNVFVGGTGQYEAKQLTVNGHIHQNDDLDTTGGLRLSTFKTGTGVLSLNGDVNLAHGKDLTMDITGSGTFTTGTGAITLAGDTTISSGKTLNVDGTTFANIRCDKGDAEGTTNYCTAQR